MNFDVSILAPFFPDNLVKLTYNLAIEPHWIDGAHFWYKRDVEQRDGTRGKRFVRVDARTGERTAAFDHERLAAQLAVKLGPATASIGPDELPFDEFVLVDGGSAIQFVISGRKWRCDLPSYRCRRLPAGPMVKLHEVLSPDGQWAAYLRGHNIYVRGLETGQTHALTTDGRRDDNYGRRPDFYGSRTLDDSRGIKQPPILAWSPDSTRILTHRLDQRHVRRLPVMQFVPDGEYAPAKVRMMRYPMAGDRHLPLVQHVILGLDGSRVDIQGQPLELANTDAPLGPTWHNVWWSEDGSAVYCLHPKRGARTMQLCSTDAQTGDVRVLLEEHTPTFADQDSRTFGLPDVRILSDNTFIWPSQRDGWYHLYLHDLVTGAPIRSLTDGDYVVTSLVSVDESAGWVYFMASGREAGRDRYLEHLYRVRLDGTAFTLLTPEDADHAVHMSPNHDILIDTYSRIDKAPVTVLRRSDGQLIAPLEQADITKLLAAGYVLPERFRVQADDGRTDLYGILIRPANFDPAQKYPLIDYEYGGPWTYITPKNFPVASRSFMFNLGFTQVLAQLGFAVMVMDGRGTAGRSKAFHDAASFLGDAAGLTDHVPATQQLARQHSFIDIDRVGIYGFSGGGYGAARAILQWPECYKVAVAGCGDHDHRLYDTTYWDRYVGTDDIESYPAQDNQSLASNLQGHLLLMHGDMDDNVHPSSTMRLVHALISADKDFDMLLLPNRGHTIYFDPYVLRRTCEYFLRHL